MDIKKSLYSGKSCLILTSMCFKFSRQKEADPILCILQDTDLHFPFTLMKQQPSCPPPLTAPLILQCALTNPACLCSSLYVCFAGAYSKYFPEHTPVKYALVCRDSFTARSLRYLDQDRQCLFLERVDSLRS